MKDKGTHMGQILVNRRAGYRKVVPDLLMAKDFFFAVKMIRNLLLLKPA